MARIHGPNDFHFAQDETGGLVQKPGLGADEPTEITRDQIMREAEVNAQREVALNAAAERLTLEEHALQQRETDLDDRERRLQEREKALAEAGSANADARRATARQATERTAVATPSA